MLTLAQHDAGRGRPLRGYISDFGRQPVTLSTALILHGLWYSATILLILGAHELGHYLACRYYQVDASLPFFIPMPLVLTGTLGAFIRIREPIPTKRMLFDIGIAGPLAGFVFAVPALFIGVALSPVVRVPDDLVGLQSRRAAALSSGDMADLGIDPDGYSLNLHPMAFAAWFGLLATALNLFPIGQLDGGQSRMRCSAGDRRPSRSASIGVAIGLTFFSTSWLVWTFLLVAMTLAMGPRHPRTIDEDIPLDRARIWLAVAGAGHSGALLHAKPDRADRITEPVADSADTPDGGSYGRLHAVRTKHVVSGLIPRKSVRSASFSEGGW